MAKIIIHIPKPDFTLRSLQEALDISLEAAFFIRRLCWYEFAPEEIPLKTPVLPPVPGQPLSQEEEILLVSNALIGSQGLGYLRDLPTNYQFPYIDRGDRAKTTLAYVFSTFELASLAAILVKYPMLRAEKT